jgi:undecaprenyl-diphosphatase
MSFLSQAYNILNQTNIAAFQFSKEIASPLLNTFMHYLPESFIVVIPLILIYMYFKKDKNVFSFIVLFFALFIIGEIIKYIVKEPRPCNMPELSWINSIGCESSYSFPSNHATVLTGVGLFTSSYKYLRVFYVIWLFLIFFGRIYLGLHYLTDVIAGIIISLAISWPVYKYYSHKINSKLARVFYILSNKLGLSKLCPKEWYNE